MNLESVMSRSAGPQAAKRERNPRALTTTTAKLTLTLALAAFTVQARAQATSPTASEANEASEAVYEDIDALADPEEPVDVSVFGSPREVKRVAGSAHRIDEKELKRFEDDNIHRTLSRVPGVYVRGEDGYGLRPNIGLRGANSDRSKKITLLEDGVLLGPAPYAAPAAYYFPLVTRMRAIEVFKGPSALRHGPNTIGGAINMVTRPIPYGHRFGSDLALGSEAYAKAHGYYGYGSDHWGLLLEGARLRSDGFKELDASPALGPSPKTGFDKLELMAKGRINTDPGSAIYNEATLKIGYAKERSHETYLGLTDADFRANPLRRYAGSQLGEMNWNRSLVEVAHNFVWQQRLTLRTTAYRHDFSRAWLKLNRFDNGPALADVLANPTSGRRAVFYQVLTGAIDSSSPGERLMVGTNDRRYIAQGLQTRGTLTLPDFGPLKQRAQFGLRIHQDEVVRLHTEDSFSMRSGRLVNAGQAQSTSADNAAEALALSGYVVDEIAAGNLMLTPGLRFETILTDYSDALAGSVTDGSQRVLLPGVGAIYQVIDELSLLGGIHQGFSPVAPGQPNEVKPEISTNYEAGARFSLARIGAEAIGFFSDYENLTGQCTFSSGCAADNLDDQFNGGRVFLYGLELSAKGDAALAEDIIVPFSASYTLTQSSFRTSFSSENPQFGDVQKGDELPYVPNHQLAITAGVESLKWGAFSIGATFVDAMREEAGQGPTSPAEETDAHLVFDASASYPLMDEMQAYLKMENVFDNEYIISRRPFGARPGRPRFFYAGLRIELGEH